MYAAGHIQAINLSGSKALRKLEDAVQLIHLVSCPDIMPNVKHTIGYVQEAQGIRNIKTFCVVNVQFTKELESAAMPRVRESSGFFKVRSHQTTMLKAGGIDEFGVTSIKGMPLYIFMCVCASH